MSTVSPPVYLRFVGALERLKARFDLPSLTSYERALVGAILATRGVRDDYSVDVRCYYAQECIRLWNGIPEADRRYNAFDQLRQLASEFLRDVVESLQPAPPIVAAKQTGRTRGAGELGRLERRSVRIRVDADTIIEGALEDGEKDAEDYGKIPTDWDPDI